MRAELRDTAIREIGCICCLHDGRGHVPCEKHHLLTTGLHGNGKRRGEAATVGLCSYHHVVSAIPLTIAAHRLRVSHVHSESGTGETMNYLRGRTR